MEVQTAGRVGAAARPRDRVNTAQQLALSLYLERCQVDTPLSLVKRVWRHVHEYRQRVGCVLDFGAGDGRFAQVGAYSQYVGYEIDRARLAAAPELPSGATLLNTCAFANPRQDGDVCVGNPPYVR